jgi:hypothetical protein
MKKLSIEICIVIFAICFCTNLFGQNKSASTLSEKAAINQIKQDGSYNSLVKAVKKAQGVEGSLSGNQTENAVGQSVKLTANDHSTNDFFGYSVAIDQDSAIVGAFGDDGFTGSAYIFSRTGTTWSFVQKITASNSAVEKYFGFDVEISGDTAIVGAFGDNNFTGAAYVFTNVNGVWTEQQILKANDGSPEDSFGWSVAINGNTAFVGAYGDDDFKGSAYVFTRNGNLWSQQQKLTDPNGATTDQFGWSLSITSNTAIISANEDDDAGFDSGSAFVYFNNGASWAFQQKLTASDGADNDSFGWSVAIDNNTAVIGASGDDGIRGSAYVFTRSGSVWTEQQKLIANDRVPKDEFGNSVAISGGTILIGASGDEKLRGSVYVFINAGNVWNQQQKILTSDGEPDDSFGWSMAISDKTAIVGAFLDDNNDTDSGSAYILRIIDPFWGEEILATPATGVANDLFGISVSISGNTAVIGASGTNNSQGTAYVYIKNGSNWTLQQTLTSSDGAAGDNFGKSVSIKGDYLVVGANSKAGGKGSAYVFFRTGTSWTEQKILNASDGVADDNFGGSVSIDSGTAIIGASGDDAAKGSAYVFVRSGTDWIEQTPKLTANDGVAGDLFGTSVSINSNTIIAGASGDDSSKGSAYIFFRTGNTFTQQQKLTANDGVANDLFGTSVSVNFDTAIAGANGDDSSKGSAYVFVRSNNTWAIQQKLIASDGIANDNFGFSTSIDGDVIIVGADQNTIGSNANQGSAYIYHRTGSFWTEIQNAFAFDGQAQDKYGSSVSVSGDKLIIGAPYKDIAAAKLTGDNLAGADQGGVYFRINQFVVPTAANVSVRGRVLSPTGRGVARAIVHITDTNGNVRRATTNQFGYYRFEDIEVGETYIFNVFHKQYQFNPLVVSFSENFDNFDIRAQQ